MWQFCKGMCVVIVLVAMGTFFVVSDAQATYLFASDSTNGNLYRVDIGTGSSTLFISGLSTPEGVAVGPDGNLYIAQVNAIKRYNISTGAYIDNFVSAGGGGLTDARGIEFGPDGHLFVNNYNGNPGRVLRYHGRTAAPLPSWGSGGATFVPYWPATLLGMNRGLTFGPDGHLYDASWAQHMVQRINGSTGYVLNDIFANVGAQVPLASPHNVTFGSDGNLYVSEASWNAGGASVLRYNGTTGAYINTFVAPGSGGVALCNGLRFGPDGYLYVGKSDNPNPGKVNKYNGTTGAFISTFLGPYSGATFDHLAFSSDTLRAPESTEVFITRPYSGKNRIYNRLLQAQAALYQPYLISRLSAFRRQLTSSVEFLINGTLVTEQQLIDGNGTVTVGGTVYTLNGSLEASGLTGQCRINASVTTSPSSTVTYRFILDPTTYVGQSFAIGSTTGTIVQTPNTTMANVTDPLNAVIGGLSMRRLTFRRFSSYTVKLRCDASSRILLEFIGTTVKFDVIPPLEAIDMTLSTSKPHNVYNYSEIGQIAIPMNLVNTTVGSKSYSYTATITDYDGATVWSQQSSGSLPAMGSSQVNFQPSITRLGSYKLVVNMTDTGTNEVFRRFLTFGVVSPVTQPVPPNLNGKFAVSYFGESAQNAELFKRIGITWGREPIYWRDVNPSPTVFDWTIFNALFTNDTNNGVKVMATEPPWAPEWAFNGNYITDKWGTFKDFDRTAWSTYWTQNAQHYAGQMGAWEPLNEAYYYPISVSVSLLQSAYTAIKAQDANVPVIAQVANGYPVGNGDTMQYLSEWLAAGGISGCDVVSAHPYGGFGISPEAADMLQKSLDIKSMVAAYRTGVPLWWTEYAWLADDEYNPDLPPLEEQALVTERRQAQFIVRAYLEGLAADIKRMFYFVSSDRLMYQFPVAVLRDEGIRPAFCGINTICRVLEFSDYVSDVDLQAGVKIRVFSKTGTSMAAVWSSESPEHDYILRVPLAASSVTVLDMMGNTITYAPGSTVIDIPFDGSPAFISSTTLSTDQLKAALLQGTILSGEAQQYMYASDPSVGTIYRINTLTSAVEVFASGISSLTGLGRGPDGNLYVGTGSSIVRYDTTTKELIGTFVPSGSGGLNGAAGVIFGPDGNLYVSSFNTGQVMRYNGATGYPMPGPGKTGAVFAEGGGLEWNRGLTFGPDGNLYVASWISHNVLRYDGDSGAFIDVFANVGAQVNLASPFDVAFGSDGHLYVSESSWNTNGNSVLRYNGTTGAFIDYFVPSGSGGLSLAQGLAFAANGSLYVGSYSNGRRMHYSSTGAFLEYLNFGTNVTYISWAPAPPTPQYLFAADAANGKIYRVDTETPRQEVFASGVASLSGLAYGPDGNLYVGSGSSIVRYDTYRKQLIGTFVPSGSGGLNVAGGVIFGPDGNLYVSSYNTGQVMRYNGATGYPMPAPGQTGAVFAQGGGLGSNRGLTFGPDGNLYVASWISHNVLRFNGTTGAFIDVFADVGLVVSYAGVYDVAFGPDNNLYVTEASWNGGGNSVLRFNGTTGAYIDTFIPSGGSGMLSLPNGLRFGPSGNLYLASNGNGRLVKYNGRTGALMTPAPMIQVTGAQFTYISFAKAPPRQHVYAGVGTLNQIQRFDPVTRTGRVFASVTAPQGLDIGPDSNLYVATGDSVVRYDTSTRELIDTFVPSGSGGLSGASGVRFGPDGNLYVNSYNTSQVMRYNGTTGAPLPAPGKTGAVFAEGGGMGWNRGLTFGPDGNLYVASVISHNVLRFNGTTGAYIDVFANVAAQVPYAAPFDVVFGGDGKLYVTESSWNTNGNSVLRYNGTTGAFVDIFVPAGGGQSQAMGLRFGPYGDLYLGSYNNGWILQFDRVTGAGIYNPAWLTGGLGGFVTISNF